MIIQRLFSRFSFYLLAWCALAFAPGFAQTITHVPLFTFHGDKGGQFWQLCQRRGRRQPRWPAHRADVAKRGDVPKPVIAVREKRRTQDGKRSVFSAADAHGSFEPSAALNADGRVTAQGLALNVSNYARAFGG